jgi:hypothetical protein
MRVNKLKKMQLFTKYAILLFKAVLIFIVWADFSYKLDKIEKNTRIEKKE